MIDLSFNDGPVEKKPEIDPERLNRLIGVLQSKSSSVGEPAYLIAVTFDELVELTEFLEENALDSETTIRTIKKRLETKIQLIEKRG